MCRRTREVAALVKACERQGFRVKQTRKGWVVYAKDRDGGTVGFHNTPSDHRSLKNTRADLRRIGVEV